MRSSSLVFIASFIIFILFLLLSSHHFPFFVLFIALISSIVCIGAGSSLGSAAPFISTVAMFSALSISFCILYTILPANELQVFKIYSWFEIGSLHQDATLMIDSLTAIMLIVIFFISFLVHMYCYSYMSSDPLLSRFMGYLSLFTFFMVLFVTSGNLLQMFAGWEGVGLSSFLLINFWNTRDQACKSALKAVIVNRFGDVSLLFACFICWFLFGTFDYSQIFSEVGSFSSVYFNFLGFNVHALSCLTFFIFFGCAAKSAQLGFHTWLPDAMEGPTPVSALIHAATMVTAGVFLLIRFSCLFELCPTIRLLVIFFSASTIIFAGSSGLFQTDLKRVIAYSTCSQLGYMVLAAAFSAYSIALFHLTTHAFFKALLFLSAGSIIHALDDEQDVRRMGGLLNLLPVTYTCFLIGSLTLMGFPYTSGFYSKDSILEITAVSLLGPQYFGLFLSILGAVITGLYSLKLLYFAFLSETNVNRSHISYVSEPAWSMLVPLVTLSFLSLFSGYILKDLFIGIGSDVFSMGLNFGFDFYHYKAEFVDASWKFLPIFVSFLISFLLILIYFCWPHLLAFFWSFNLYFFFSRKWFFDLVYNFYIVFPLLSFGYNGVFKLLDRGFVELVGPTGLVRFLPGVNFLISSLQSGYLFNYVFLFVFFVFVCLYSLGDFRLLFLIFLFLVFSNVLNKGYNIK